MHPDGAEITGQMGNNEVVSELAGIIQGVYKRGLSGNTNSTRALEIGKKVEALSDAAWALIQ